MTESPTYYDRPTLKEPVWIWSVPAYFYVGGAAGAAAVLGAAAQIIDRDRLRNLITACRRTAAGGVALGSVFLVIDLGRPERFLNMLRVFRPTSAMSVGSWVLAASGAATTGAAVLDRRALGDVAGAAAGVLGLPLAGYTAVLLADTAVPLWNETRRSLPLLFVSSAISSAADLLAFAELDEHEHEVVHRFGLAGNIAELAAGHLFEKDARRVERVARPLKDGLGGSLWKTSKVATIVSLVLSVVAGRSRWGRWVAALLGNAGAVSLRFAIFHAGKASSRDPRATFETQRQSEPSVRH
jgi:formate-dependent nitrite reductase membrane component NrfD